MGGYRSVAELIVCARGFRVPIDKHVLGVLSTFADFRTGAHAHMTVNTLASRAGLGRRRVLRALRRLEADGWIRAARRHRRPTSYDINTDLLKTCWTSVQSLLKSAGLSDTGVTQLSDTRVTQTPDLSDTGVTPSPIRTDPQYRDPQTEEAALRAARFTALRQLTFGPMETTPMRAWRNKHGRRPTLPADNVGATCDCLECRAAGVTHLQRIRVPADGFVATPRWLHGEELKTWYEARARGLDAMRAALPSRRRRS